MENGELQQKINPRTYHLKEPKRSHLEIPANVFEYNQALILKSKFMAPLPTENSILDKRAASVSPRRASRGKLNPNKMPYLKHNVPLATEGVDPALFNLSSNNAKILRNSDFEEFDNRNFSALDVYSFPKDEPISGSFRRPRPNSTLQKFVRRVKEKVEKTRNVYGSYASNVHEEDNPPSNFGYMSTNMSTIIDKKK